ncbi:hypothetical protein ABZ896_19675 [Streptomyces sp. NPDC047072]|uniref:hypothetical protein n=1 Tax=Streptomyces sp. NPDC047072 TaxID=3154809 RepID=UPI0033CDB744
MGGDAAVCAAQFPAVGLIWWVGTLLGDDYGAGGALNPLVVFAVPVLLALAVLVVPALGCAQALLQILPAEFLARRALRRAREPLWAWHLVFAVLLGVAWAVPVLLLWDRPFTTTTAALLAALGVLPVLGFGWLRRRPPGSPRGVHWSARLCVLVGVGAVLGVVTGVVKGYEPPELSAAQLAGAWRGADGAVLGLHTGVFAVCDGTGSWLFDDKGGYDPYGDGPEGRPGVVVRVDGGCGQETYWRIGGTADEPELFVAFGDPDAPDLRILTRG